MITSYGKSPFTFLSPWKPVYKCGHKDIFTFSNEGFHQNIQMVHSLKFDASAMIHYVYLHPRLPGDDMFKIFHLKTNCVFPLNAFH